MGKKGIEIVAAKIDINEVISDLNKAYADCVVSLELTASALIPLTQ